MYLVAVAGGVAVAIVNLSYCS